MTDRNAEKAAIEWKRNDPQVPVRVFPNRTSFDFWLSNNCGHCRFFSESRVLGFANCPILDSLYGATAGTMPEPFARLFGIGTDGYVDDVCPGYQERGSIPAPDPPPVGSWMIRRASGEVEHRHGDPVPKIGDGDKFWYTTRE